MLSADGADTKGFTFDVKVSGDPTWSYSDGSRIAYVFMEVSANREIYVINVDGTKPDESHKWYGWRHPAWSPNNACIALTGEGEEKP
ncbi:MAG: hypothetical protein U0694_15840 [Anaerolineae bacterium]